jgi:hypothetical protein
MNRKIVILGVIAATCLLLPFLRAYAQTPPQVAGEWAEPEPISPEGEWSWFPTMTFDPYGQLHVIWCWTRPNPNSSGLLEQVKYTRLNGTQWEKANDIIPPSADIERNAIVADQIGNLHLAFGGSAYGNLEIYYQTAPSQEAWSAKAWTTPLRLNQGGSYYTEIEVDSQGNLHVIFDDTIYEQNADSESVVVSDIYYRKSSDGGNNWSWPFVLQYRPESGSARPTLLVDQQDVIHVTWDEGWDRLTGQRSEEFYSVYMYSADGGTTWSEPTEIHYPDKRIVQLTVGSNNQGGVMLVWRSMERAEIYYQWSTNQGETWTKPIIIPDIYARPWSFPHDRYTMITDSAGNIHLLVSARSTSDPGAEIGIYHLIWNGETWSRPRQVFLQEGLLAFYPSAAIRNGNELHATWFTMERSEWQDDVDRAVWHSWSQLLVPREIVTPWPTPSLTPTKVILTPTPDPTSTPLPDFVGGSSQENRSLIQPDPYSEIDELAILGIALLPIVFVIIAIIAIRWISVKK